MQQMPHSIEAEKALLGAMLIYPTSVRTAFEIGMEKEDFYLNAHQLIFNAMSVLNDNGSPIDATSLVTKLIDLNALQQVGGTQYIMQLTDGAVTSANTKHYSEMIKEKAVMRNLILACNEIVSDCFDSTNENEEIMDIAEKKLLDITRNRRTTSFKGSEELVSNVLDNIYKMRENKSSITGMKTGYVDLDRITNGLQAGDMIILAARPSMGKTAFALNVGLQIAMHNKNACAIFSLEMPAESLVQRMLSAKAKITGSKLRTGFLTSRELNGLNEAAADLKQLGIYIDDSPGIKMPEIFSKCRKLQSEREIGVIIIDYIQLISGGSKKAENRQQEVSDISRNLKALARELNVPVIALSQLSRSVEQRENKRPMMSDLRESGSLEQDADLIAFLYRDSYYNKYKKSDEEMSETPEVKEDENAIEKTELIIAKHRNGPTGDINLAFAKSVNAFYDFEEEKEGL